jgi:hypothetical protein
MSLPRGRPATEPFSLGILIVPLTHTFSLAPCSRFTDLDPIWQHIGELETIEITDDDFMAIQAELSQIPVDGGRIGVDQVTSNAITPENATEAERQFMLARQRVSDPKLREVCERLSDMAQRAAANNCILYHSGL